ncbi:16S rRNA (uracil(1498)-N(3))-methyltransferase [Alloscardovia criceti]|uniref:16S rRNA (uracil(1498)-N(3))-methyltransferase n=1 Tax=Alloscardovia criceti TaxID=356828 RepID=UPI000476BC54|nr:16S rRNA (uracil(1498)-N(3))-methyltransferase [Alloscardovia criceti]
MTLPMFVIRAHEKTNSAIPHEVGALYTLPPAVATHAIRSMRLNTDEELQLCDGNGLRIIAHIVDPQQASVCIDEINQEEEPKIKLGLIQALAKSGRDEQAIEMATEIGVDKVIPWQSQRSIVQWKGNKAQKALNKWQDLVTGASEQSRRSFVPDIYDVMTTKQLNAWMATSIAQGDVVIVLHQDATDSWSGIEQRVKTLKERTESSTVWVVVGPEGGITDDEVEMFKTQGAQVCVIGTNILRASSAGSVALTLLSRVLERYA